MNPVYLAALILLAGGLLVVTTLVVRRYRRLAGTRLVSCPETHEAAAVTLDASHALATSLGSSPDLRLDSCSRWPERKGCGQECLGQIEAAPEDCLVRNLLREWYRGKSCILCGRAFEEIHWGDHKPAFIDSKRRTWRWNEIAPERLPSIMATHHPVCWDCDVIERVYRDHPDLVVERPDKWGPTASRQ